MTHICRPQKITPRWINEITKAINKQCPQERELFPIQVSNQDNLESIWNDYIHKLENNKKCIKNPTVQKILKFEIDYNDLEKQS